MIERIRQHPLAQITAITTALLLLSLIVGFSQIKTEGLGWQEANYMPRLEAVVAGEAPAPWQYRLLTDHAVVSLCRVAEFVGIPRPVGITFVLLRLVQNMALFGLAFFYYRNLGLHTYAIVFGLSALAWGMTQSNYGSDLAFNAYSDILFYLCAALVLLHRRYEWLIPIAVLAALNRETSGLLPVMAIAGCLSVFRRTQQNRDLLRHGVTGLGLYVTIQVALWLYFGPRDFVVHSSGAVPGMSMLRYNLGNDAAWGHVAGTLGIVPVLAFLSYRAWHRSLFPLFWSIVPVWFAIHIFCAPLDESRVFLLPQVLVFIPGMLCGLAYWQGDADDAGKRGLLA